MDRSLAAAAGLAVEPVFVAEDMAAFAAAAGMIEAAACLAAGLFETEAAFVAAVKVAVPCFAARSAVGLAVAVLVAAGRPFGLVSAADMNS